MFFLKQYKNCLIFWRENRGQKEINVCQCVLIWQGHSTNVHYWHMIPLTSPVIKTQSSVFMETVGFP